MKIIIHIVGKLVEVKEQGQSATKVNGLRTSTIDENHDPTKGYVY